MWLKDGFRRLANHCIPFYSHSSQDFWELVWVNKCVDFCFTHKIWRDRTSPALGQFYQPENKNISAYKAEQQQECVIKQGKISYLGHSAFSAKVALAFSTISTASKELNIYNCFNYFKVVHTWYQIFKFKICSNYFIVCSHLWLSCSTASGPFLTHLILSVIMLLSWTLS